MDGLTLTEIPSSPTTPPIPETKVTDHANVDLDEDDEENAYPLTQGPAKPTVSDELRHYMSCQKLEQAMEILGYQFQEPLFLLLALTSPDFFQKFMPLPPPLNVFLGTVVEPWLFRYEGLGEVGIESARLSVTTDYLEDVTKDLVVQKIGYVLQDFPFVSY